MADLLVRLYDLPPLAPALEAAANSGVTVRRALATEKAVVADFAREHGSAGWAAECEIAFARQPLACFVAVEGGSSAATGAVRAPSAYATAAQILLGFACYEATCRDFFGPQAVRPDRRGRGIGRALLLSALHGMRAEGYAYAIIGWATEIDFYRKVAAAVPIAGSEPGIYPPPLSDS
jgi:ribosomal protein S18 acetylase RimI-like enzyme